MAYYLGWIWADGSISKNGYQLIVGALSSEEDVVLRFRKDIGSHNKIQRSKRKVSKQRVANPFTTVSICSKDLVDALIKHGIKAGKSKLDCEFPYVPEKYINHFVRGYFDGDGSLFCTKQGYYRVSLVGGSRFIAGIAHRISKSTGLPLPKVKKHVKSKRVRYIDWSRKEQIIMFLNFIYPKGKYPYLKRKRDFAASILPKLHKYCDMFGIDKNKGKYRLRLGQGQHIGYFSTVTEARKMRDRMIDQGNFSRRVK